MADKNAVGSNAWVGDKIRQGVSAGIDVANNVTISQESRDKEAAYNAARAKAKDDAEIAAGNAAAALPNRAPVKKKFTNDDGTPWTKAQMGAYLQKQQTAGAAGLKAGGRVTNKMSPAGEQQKDYKTADEHLTMKAGGKVRGVGCAVKGHGKGKMR